MKQPTETARWRLLALAPAVLATYCGQQDAPPAAPAATPAVATAPAPVTDKEQAERTAILNKLDETLKEIQALRSTHLAQEAARESAEAPASAEAANPQAADPATPEAPAAAAAPEMTAATAPPGTAAPETPAAPATAAPEVPAAAVPPGSATPETLAGTAAPGAAAPETPAAATPATPGTAATPAPAEPPVPVTAAAPAADAATTPTAAPAATETAAPPPAAGETAPAAPAAAAPTQAEAPAAGADQLAAPAATAAPAIGAQPRLGIPYFPTQTKREWRPNTVSEGIGMDSKRAFFQSMMMVSPLSMRDMVSVMAYKKRVKEGLSFEDVVEAMRIRANAVNFKQVGHNAFWKDVKAITGKDTPRVEIFQFCDAVVGQQILNYAPEFVVFLPCRIAVLEDADGRLWVMTLDWDVAWLDYAQNPNSVLDANLRAEARRIRDAMEYIIEGGATGEW